MFSHRKADTDIGKQRELFLAMYSTEKLEVPAMDGGGIPASSDQETLGFLVPTLVGTPSILVSRNLPD